MIFNLLSDIHLESGALHWEIPEEAQAIVLAGDVAPNHQALDWLRDLAGRVTIPIIYVPGNHDFWDVRLPHWIEYARNTCRDIGVDFLYNDVLELGDTVILGTTLWTDFNLSGNQPLKMLQAPGVMKDYDHISDDLHWIRPARILQEHQKARSFLETNLALHRDRKRLVVTHHCPSGESLPDASHRHASFYASALDDLMLEYEPDAWFHGHSHTPVHYWRGETLVLSNPRGHITHPAPHFNPLFDPQFLVEI